MAVAFGDDFWSIDVLAFIISTFLQECPVTSKPFDADKDRAAERKMVTGQMNNSCCEAINN